MKGETGYRCAYVHPKLPVVIVGANSEPFVEKEDTVESFVQTPTKFLTTGIDLLADILPKENIGS